MKLKYFSSAFIFAVILTSSAMQTLNFAQQISPNAIKPWKGNAILGNGHICVVYSDDRRITAESKGKGIQHFYYKDYTADYISSSSFELIEATQNSFKNPKPENQELGIENAFCGVTKSQQSGGLTQYTRCYVHPKDAAIMSLSTTGTNGHPTSFKFQLSFRKDIITDVKTSLISLKKQRNSAIAQWSNKVVIVISPKSSRDIVEVEDSTVSIYGQTSVKGKSDIIITASDSLAETFSRIQELKSEQDLYASASAYWNKWLKNGITPEFKANFPDKGRYLDYYRRTLYAVKAATLNGMIPADITGQFVTNNMPQLYPRDAMMCARVFLMTGHPDEAKDIIEFWTKPGIPKKSKGEFYARYDAYSKAVDAGSGARYDEPEWDANGYFIQLVNEYHKQNKIWLADKSFIYELADFLVMKIDKAGLLYEGGIVEWTGYLPSTNMTSAAALKTASEIAQSFGDKDKAQTYLKASETITNSLSKCFDTKRGALCDIRFHGVKAEGNVSITEQTQDTLYLWDTSLNFGILWGFPNNHEIGQTNKFIQTNNVKNGGGVQYFEAKDNAWLSGYGGDLFFFTTAAEAQYQSLYGNNSIAKQHIDWMINNSNSYGLMPERIYSNLSDCSPASPLSWCSAEFAAALLQWSKKQ